MNDKYLVNVADLRGFIANEHGVVITFSDGTLTDPLNPKDITVFGHGEQLVREWLKGLDSKTEED